MITEDSINFLKKIPPFQFLEETSLRAIAGNLSLEYLPKNTMILTQDGPPSDALRVIKKGGVKVFLSNDDEIVIDYKTAGDSFGYLSLISGDKSRANVQAFEDTLCYLIPRDTIMQIINTEPMFGEYFMKSFFKNYLDRTYKEMRNKNLLFKEGEKILYTTPVKDLISRSAVTAGVDISIREAAGIMSENRISSLILTDENKAPVGIITDRDMRDRVVAKGIDLSIPVKDIMSAELISINGRETCFNALAAMIQKNIHHMIITDGNVLKGVVTNHDFMILQGTSPLSILKNIDQLRNADELPQIHDKIYQTISLLLKEGVKAGNILRIITELHDKLIHKIIDLGIQEINASPCLFAFFVYGAEGRREETFKTVFHCAIVYEDDLTYSRKKEMETYCQQLLGHLQSIFKKCGLPLFEMKPLGERMPPFGDISEWESNIASILQSPENKYFDTAKKILDLRMIHGDKGIARSLKDRLYKGIQRKNQFHSIFNAQTLKQKSPVAFLRKFVVDVNGEQLEKFDIKERGISYIVDSIRVLAIAHNIYRASTNERLNVLAKKESSINEIREDVYDAFEFMLHLLLEAQQVKRDMNQTIDNVIEPAHLTMLEKKILKEVFQIIQKLQGTVKGILQRQKATA